MGVIVWILVGVVAALAVLLVYAATRPSSFSLTRSARIDAPAARIFPLIADFHQWTLWSPWEKMDPTLQRTYSGAPNGIGAIYEWAGPKTGQGRMEITDVREAADVKIKLDFFKPFRASNIAVFDLKEQGGHTLVTWTMSGPQAFMGKLMSVFMNMDKMVGKSFEDGLSDLKRVAEAA